MTTKVTATDAAGLPQLYEYDRESEPLGAGHTGIVYAGWAADQPDKKVAIKVARTRTDEDMQRELAVLTRLYAPGQPGGDAVLWAIPGREVDGDVAAACMVMELIGMERQLGRRLMEMGQRKKVGVDLLEKEIDATRFGLHYARLLSRMAGQGVISRGDRKATDFRLMPDSQGNERLVVLDWNRAEIIDIAALQAEKRWSETYINRRQRELADGQMADLRIFAGWWAEFVLGRALTGPLPALDDERDPAWAALSRGFRHILLRAEAAGSARGFASAQQLVSALSQHNENLALEDSEILSALGKLQKEGSPTLRDDILNLVDLGRRWNLPRESLESWLNAAEGSHKKALDTARAALERLSAQIHMREWGHVGQTLDQTRRQLGDIGTDSADAHLLLLRWRVVATAGQSQRDNKEWAENIKQLLDAMPLLAGLPAEWRESRRNLVELNKQYPGHATGLDALLLEVDLRIAPQDPDAAEKYDRLKELNPDYAAVLRLTLPALDNHLAMLARVTEREDSVKSLRDDFTDRYLKLFQQFDSDVAKGNLPPRDYPAAHQLAAAYQGKWDDYYEVRARLLRAAPDDRTDADHISRATWLQELLEAMLRLRADAAAALLINDPPTGLPIRLEAVRVQCLRRWLDLLAEEADGGRARWPDDVERAIRLVDHLIGSGDGAVGPRATTLRAQLADIHNQQNSLRQQLRVLDYEPVGDWAGFMNYVTTNPSSAIDEALHEAGERRLEVWRPAAVAEDAFDADYPARVRQGYRAGTLLALRTANLLPERVRSLNRELSAFALELEANRGDIDLAIGHFRDAGGYPQQMSDLTELLGQMKSQLSEFMRTEKAVTTVEQRASLASNRLAAKQRELTSSQAALNRLIDQLSNTINAADGRLASFSPLAEIGLARTLDQAAQGEPQLARESLAAVQGFIAADHPLRQWAVRIAGDIEQLEKHSQIDYGRGSVWTQLRHVRDKIAAGDQAGATAAWRQVPNSVPNGDKNLVFYIVERNLSTMSSSTPEATPPTPTPTIAPEQVDEPPKEPDIPLHDRTSTKAPSYVADKITALEGMWGPISTGYEIRHNSPQVRVAAKETDSLLNNRLSSNDLNKLDKWVDRALKIGWDDRLLADDDDNFGHLYVLRLKIERLLPNKTQ